MEEGTNRLELARKLWDKFASQLQALKVRPVIVEHGGSGFGRRHFDVKKVDFTMMSGHYKDGNVKEEDFKVEEYTFPRPQIEKQQNWINFDILNLINFRRL